MIRYCNSKHDKNHGEIVAILEKLGATVIDLAAVGHGVPDIIIGFRGMNFLAEIKQPKKQLSIGQLNLKLWWRGGKIHTLRTERDIINILGI